MGINENIKGQLVVNQCNLHLHHRGGFVASRTWDKPVEVTFRSATLSEVEDRINMVWGTEDKDNFFDFSVTLQDAIRMTKTGGVFDAMPLQWVGEYWRISVNPPQEASFSCLMDKEQDDDEEENEEQTEYDDDNTKTEEEEFNPNVATEHSKAYKTHYGDIILVRWYGAVFSEGLYTKDSPTMPHEYCTVGRVVAYNDFAITISSTTMDGDDGFYQNIFAPVVIPQKSIIEIRELFYKPKR